MTVYITDAPTECFNNLLMFLYIGAVELNLEYVLEVMYAALRTNTKLYVNWNRCAVISCTKVWTFQMFWKYMK